MRNMLNKFYILGAIVVIIISLGLVFQFTYFNKIIIKDAKTLTSSSSDTVGTKISSTLLNKGQIISDASDYISLEKWNKDELLTYMRRLMSNNSSFSSIYFGSVDNEMINGSGWVPPQSFDLRSRPWYIKAKDENKLIFTEAFVNASKDKLIVTIAKPVYSSNGQLLGVVAGDVSVNDILTIVKDKKINGTGYSFLIDGNGNILAHPKYQYNATSQLKNISEISQKLNTYLYQDNSGITKISLDKVDGYLAYQSIDNTDWKIGSFIPLNEYMENETQFFRIFMFTLISTLFILLVFLWQHRKFIVTPMLELSKDIQKINIESDISFRLPVVEKEFIASIRKYINIALNKTQELFSKLESSEEKLKNLINQMQQGLVLNEVILNENDEVINYRFLDANESYERLTGLKRKDILGKTALEVLPYIEKHEMEKFEYVAKTGEHVIYENYVHELDRYYEMLVYRPKLLQFAILINDITERKKVEKAVKASENNFRAVFEGSSDSIILIKNGIITDCNFAAVELLGYNSKENIIGKGLIEISPEKQPDGKSSREKSDEMLELTVKNANHKFEWWHKRSDSTLIPVEVMLTLILINGEETIHALGRDVSVRKQFEQKLEYMSYHDQLTGLYNRRFFEEELIRLDLISNLPLSIVMADVNGLKLINDSFGHALGDHLLMEVGEIFKKVCRPNDVCARLGGDEFVILLPKTNDHETEDIIKRISLLAQKEKVGSINISISFGLGTKFNESQKILEIIKKAEDSMYKKKLFESPSMRGKTINTIISTLHEKNKREEQHSHRVSELCKSMGETLGLLDGEIKELETVGLLHDIGKIAIKESILNNPGKLSEDEWEEIKRHPEIGYRILSTVNDMSEMAEYVFTHHERWDGKGYPKGLKGEEIPFQSRIIAIADTYDAMTSERSYRSALSKEVAIAELEKNAGIQFDPKLVKVFVEKIANTTT